MYYDKVNRRFFLRAAGGATLAVPFLGSLVPKAFGQGAATSAAATLQNVVFFKMDYTWGYDNVKPAPGLVYEDLGHGMRRAPLPADFSQWGASYAQASAKLSPLRNQISFLSGLDYTGSRGDHWNACFLSGSGRMLGANDNGYTNELTCETIDQLLGRLIYKKRGSAPSINAVTVGYSDFSSVASILNTDGSGGTPTGTYNVGNLANVSHHDVTDLYYAIFGGLASTKAGQQAINNRDNSMLNGVMADYKALLANPRLSKIDTQNMQQYMALLSDFQNRLAAKKAIQCSLPNIGVPNTNTDWGYYEPEHSMQDLIPILSSALACGATSVVTEFLYSANLGVINTAAAAINQLLPAASQSDYHHGVIHSIGGGATAGSGDSPTPYPVALAAAAPVDAYYLGVIADFATSLQGFVNQATGQNLLDQTAIIVGREHGTCGPNYNVHMLRDMHNLVIGGTPVFNAGYFYDYKTSVPVPAGYGGAGPRQLVGLPYNDFLYATMMAMGLSPSDWELNGEAGYGFTAATTDGTGGNAPYFIRDKRSPAPKWLKGT